MMLAGTVKRKEIFVQTKQPHSYQSEISLQTSPLPTTHNSTQRIVGDRHSSKRVRRKGNKHGSNDSNPAASPPQDEKRVSHHHHRHSPVLSPHPPTHQDYRTSQPGYQKKERAHRNRLEFLDFFQSMNGWNPQAKPSGSWATQISHRLFSHAKSKHMFVGCKGAGKDQGKCWHKRLLVLTFFVWSLLPTQRSIPRAKGKIIA